MRKVIRAIVTVLAVVAIVPAGASAQEGPIEPRPIVPEPPVCALDTTECWWPVGDVARLDTVRADVSVADGSIVTHYRFTLSDAPESAGGDPSAPAEGRIVFPVPAGSSVTDLVLSGGPETLEGRLLGADDAARMYDEIVRRLVDPALLRSIGGDLYEVRAFPVPPGEQREVRFTVTTPLLADGDQAVVAVPWSRMSPRPAGAVVSVDVDVPWEVRSALAPGFELDTERSGPGRLDLSWESTDGWAPDKDFRLYVGGGDGLVAARLLAYREPGDDGTFALLLAPVLDLETVVPRDVVLVLDTSGSMEGEKMSQAIDAARYVLQHLGAQDRFGIVSFSRTVRTFRDELAPAGDVETGLAYLDDLAAGGETNISGALERGLDYLNGERPGTVIFLTDGLPTAGITDADGILADAEGLAPERTQLFAFGVGYDVDTVLLDALSSHFVGSSHYVTPDERVDTEVQSLYERISTPVLTDVDIDVQGVKTWGLAPTGLGGLFAGQQTMLTGRYDGSGPATVVLTGDSAQGAERFTYTVDFPERDGSDPTIAQLWAQRRVADLLTELRVEGSRPSLVDEIVEIATRFGIVTPYTSYIADEPDLAFRPDAAGRAVDEAVAAAPVSGEKAVQGADDIGRLREGQLALGGQQVRVLGAHSWYLVDDTWVRDGFEPGTEAPEIRVGSAEFAGLLEAAPELAEAAALGQRVVVLGPDGWVTIVWPEPASAGTPHTVPDLPAPDT